MKFEVPNKISFNFLSPFEQVYIQKLSFVNSVICTQLLPMRMFLLVSLFTLLSIGNLYASDVISVNVLDAISLLSVVSSSASVSTLDTVEPGIEPGSKPNHSIAEVTQEGGRLHYSVFAQNGPMDITVMTETGLSSGSLYVEVVPNSVAEGVSSGLVEITASPQVILENIGNYYTGTGTSDGPLIRYTLKGDPGFSNGDVDVVFSLVLAG
ncbi:hypothetical protein [uncultured Sphaerochaeta sp.]|uniref:hypothetical protein n=1 Tax=uncultured Sphaerochaeta sp. TaxID=886478 RepID=UPI002A0A3FA3|nr:hypothetical protein [uncultured Sphaerochaeta sp.]